MRKLTIEYMRDLAASKGGTCLSEAYENRDAKLRWKCSVVSHSPWLAPAQRIQQWHWCPECGNAHKGKSQRLSIFAIRQAAKDRGGECLSAEYINNTQKLVWRCALGHAPWQATAAQIRRGRWCPSCEGRPATDAPLL